MARKTPGLNTQSTADIAFLLLCYFLMTSTMDQQSGLQRRLPPMPDQNQKTEDTKVNKRNIIIVKINSSDRLFAQGREINLTAKEFDLLELLVMNPNKVYSRENLLNLVWGYEYPGDVRTVDVHVRRLREKIEPNPSEPKYVHTKWGVGYFYQK